MSHRKLEIVSGAAPYVSAGLLFGLLYNTLFYPHTLVEYTEAATIGVLLGSAVGISEQHPALRRWLGRLSFLQTVVVRTVAYALAVAVSLALVLSVEPASAGECGYAQCVVEYVTGSLFARDVMFSTAFVFAAAFIAEIVLLIGSRNLARLVTGRYRRPREIRAEFMFVDLRGSTGLAEVLGHARYSAFLREFFVDISFAIRRARGEVYQYVGDEVVIVWQGRRAAGRWLDCFVAMRASIAAGRGRYESRYGAVPEFKAGVHAGTVIATEVGLFQRALAYHGDVLNIAARIQAMCNGAGFDLLVSREALAHVSQERWSAFEPIGPTSIRGRAGIVDVLGLSESRVAAAAAQGIDPAGRGEIAGDAPPPPAPPA